MYLRLGVGKWRPLGHSKQLLLCGLVCLPAFALQQNVSVRLLQMGAFVLMCGIWGRGVRPIRSSILFFSVVVANVLLPHGRVLFTLFSLPITNGALQLGLLKASLLVGLIHLSRLCVLGNVQLSGFFGRLLSRMFQYFEILTQNRSGLRGKPLEKLDDMLVNISENTKDQQQNNSGDDYAIRRGKLLVVFLLAGTWGVYLLNAIKVIQPAW